MSEDQSSRSLGISGGQYATLSASTTWVREKGVSPAFLDGFICRKQPLWADYSDLVKFTGRTDPNYMTVVDQIEDMVLCVVRYESISNAKIKRGQAVWSLVRPYIFRQNK